jgi:hypothetical protein
VDGEGVHRPRPPEDSDVDRRIEDGQRQDTLGVGDGPFETGPAADVVHHKMRGVDGDLPGAGFWIRQLGLGEDLWSTEGADDHGVHELSS